MELRPYQEAARRAIHREWQDVDRTLLVLPTGTGKTIVFASVIKDIVAGGGRPLILAHRGELLQQAAEKLAMATGLGCAVEKAQESALGCLERVTVGSVQSMMRPDRLQQFDEAHYTHIIIDEAHHALSDSYQAVVDHFGDAKVLGVTATPDRGDKRNLGQYFQSLAYEYTLPAAIRDGFLCPIRALHIPLSIDLGAVRISTGDFQAGDLDEALRPYMEAIADQMAEHCQGRRTLVFLPLIETCKRFSTLLRERGLNSAWISGVHAERSEILKAFEAGQFDILCNSMLLTEGYDCPAIDCVVCLRPTKIRSLYAQIIGRGTRLHPGKDHLLVLDFLWQSDRHELCKPAHLMAEEPDVARRLTEMAEAAGGPMDLTDELVTQARNDAVAERERALAEKLAEQRNKKRKLVDPLQFAVSTNAADLVDYEPEFPWEMMPPSKKQVEQLERAGIYPDEITCAGMASKLLDRIANRRASGYATPKQVRCLERFGFKKVGEMSFQQASQMITRISANGWRVPEDMLQPTEFAI